MAHAVRVLLDTRAKKDYQNPDFLGPRIGDKVMFGAHVTLLDLDSDEETTYQIVGHDEADPKQQKISVNAPIARMCMGKVEGDEVSFNRPKVGKKDYEIVSVEYK